MLTGNKIQRQKSSSNQTFLSFPGLGQSILILQGYFGSDRILPGSLSKLSESLPRNIRHVVFHIEEFPLYHCLLLVSIYLLFFTLSDILIGDLSEVVTFFSADYVLSTLYVVSYVIFVIALLYT